MPLEHDAHSESEVAQRRSEEQLRRKQKGVVLQHPTALTEQGRKRREQFEAEVPQWAADLTRRVTELGEVVAHQLRRGVGPGAPGHYHAVVQPQRPAPSEAAFKHLATDDPQGLAAWIAEGTLRPTHLTFAAEWLGRAADRALVLDALLPLLEHPKPIVREGALIGLGEHLGADLHDRLALVVQEDPCPELRAIAVGFLEDLRERGE